MKLQILKDYLVKAFRRCQLGTNDYLIIVDILHQRLYTDKVDKYNTNLMTFNFIIIVI